MTAAAFRPAMRSYSRRMRNRVAARASIERGKAPSPSAKPPGPRPLDSLRSSITAALIAAACDRSAPAPRERLLAAIRADAVTVVVADGRAISHPRVRGVLDVIASHWPARMGCVLEAAFAGEQAAISVDAGGSITVLVATASQPRCAALSRREPGLWIATIGDGPAGATGSVLDDERFARVRPYLTTAPIAAVSLGEPSAVAAAQADPLEAWLAIDAPGGARAVEQTFAERIARMQRDPSTAPVASKLRIARTDAQVVIRLDGPVDGDLAVAARAMLAGLEERAAPAAAAFVCPSPAAPDISCTDGTSYRVRSLEALASIVRVGQPAPIVSNGLVAGLRLRAPVAEIGLAADDVVLAVGGRLVTSRAMLAERLAQARGEISLTIRRGGTEKVLQFAER
jgi:hypothetical protein